MEVSLATQPTGFKLTVKGDVPRPHNVRLVGRLRPENVYAPRQRYNGRTWAFSSCSDGGVQEHTIATPAEPTTYTATSERLRR